MLYRQIWPTGGVRAMSAPRLQTPFVQGVLSSITNTKTLVLFVSFLPQFMAPEQAIAVQFVVLGAIYAGLTLVIYGVIGSLAGWAGSWLQRPLVQRIMRASAGVVIASLGVWGMIG
jgi:threonine/homoserine/homoserine lactone efflux protein